MELYVENSFQHHVVNLYLSDRQNGRGKVFINIDKETGSISYTPIEHGIAMRGEVKPFLTMAQDFWTELLPLLTAEASKKGIQTENENLLKGKLEATEKHLADMQKAFTTLLDLAAKPSDIDTLAHLVASFDKSLDQLSKHLKRDG